MSKQTHTLTVPNQTEETYAALKAAIQKLRYTIATADDTAHTLTVTTRVGAFSWGERITATVSAGEDGGSVVELCSEPKLKTNVMDMGRGKRELSMIADALLAELNGEEEQSAPAAQPAAAKSVADEIRALAQLRDEGILTEEEFTAKKQQLLGI